MVSASRGIAEIACNHTAHSRCHGYVYLPLQLKLLATALGEVAAAAVQAPQAPAPAAAVQAPQAPAPAAAVQAPQAVVGQAPQAPAAAVQSPQAPQAVPPQCQQAPQAPLAVPPQCQQAPQACLHPPTGALLQEVPHSPPEQDYPERKQVNGVTGGP